MPYWLIFTWFVLWFPLKLTSVVSLSGWLDQYSLNLFEAVQANIYVFRIVMKLVLSNGFTANQQSSEFCFRPWSTWGHLKSRWCCYFSAVCGRKENIDLKSVTINDKSMSIHQLVVLRNDNRSCGQQLLKKWRVKSLITLDNSFFTRWGPKKL